MFGAGIEPATFGIRFRCSNRLSYPVVTIRNRTGGHQPAATLPPRPGAIVVAKHLLLDPAYATAMPRAPGGTGMPRRWIAFERCFALPAVANRQFVRSTRSSSIKIGSASVRRPRRSTTTHANALTAARPWPRRGDWRRVLQGEAESGVEVAARECPCSCECWKQKAPGCGSEGIRSPRRSGRPISVNGGSVVVSAVDLSIPGQQSACAQAAVIARRFGLAHVVEGGGHDGGCVECGGGNIAGVLRWRRTIHLPFSECKHFFYIRRRTEIERKQGDFVMRYFRSGASVFQTWSRSFGCAEAIGCRRSA